MLSIGFSEIDITPAPGLPTAGMPLPPDTTGVLYPLFGRIVVFEDSTQTAALVALDNLGLEPALILELRLALSAGTDLDPEDIMIACTHTHSAPYTAAIMDARVNYQYVDFMRERLAEAMQAAWAARQPARIRAGSVNAPGWNFNRRQVYRSERYGEQVGSQGPQYISEFLRNEGPEDPQLQAVLAESADGRALGGWVNYACHPTQTYGDGSCYSADYPGALTAALAERYSCPFAFLQGASGNLWGINTALENGGETTPAYLQRMVTDLAEKSEQALRGAMVLKDGPLRSNKRVLNIAQRQPSHEQVELARWYLEKAPDYIDQMDFTRRLYGHDYTFFSNDAVIQEWLCRETVSLWEWQRRQGKRELFDEVEIQVITLGNLALVGIPAEYFTEFGLKIKAKSPFAHTHVVELTNGWHGYVPTLEAFAHGGYEPRLAYTSRLAENAGDLICTAALELLSDCASQ